MNLSPLTSVVTDSLSLTLSGIAIGVFVYLIIGALVVFLLQSSGINYQNIMKLVMCSAIGHFFGGIFANWYAVHVGSDSLYIFMRADIHSSGISYFFADKVMGYLRRYLIGDSLLGGFMLFSALGFLGSVLLLIIFKKLLDEILDSELRPHVDSKILFFPALLLLCWPTYFFWSAQLVKDSFCFLWIALVFYVISNRKQSVVALISLASVSYFGFMSRPYLFVIMAIALVIYLLLMSKQSIITKIFLIGLLFSSIPTAAHKMVAFMPHIGFSYHAISNYGISQQKLLQGHSSFSIPTHNIFLYPLFLPYLFLGNLLLPLFYGGIGGAFGLVCSFENMVLLFLVVNFFKNRKVFKLIAKKIPIVYYFFVYFVLGMTVLSAINTNTGLAMREKMMYVPSLLIIMMLTYTYRKILLMKWVEEKNNELDPENSLIITKTR